MVTGTHKLDRYLLTKKFLWWLFWVVSLAISEMNCSPEAEGTQWSRSWGWETQAFDTALEVGDTQIYSRFLYRKTQLVKDSGRGKVSFFFACLPSPRQYTYPFTALEPAALEFQHVLKTSWDTQPCGTEELLDSCYSQIATVGLQSVILINLHTHTHTHTRTHTHTNTQTLKILFNISRLGQKQNSKFKR